MSPLGITDLAQGGGGAGGDVNIHDGIANPLTSTVVGADQALDVNIVGGAGAGGTSMTDDAPFTPGATAITPTGAMFDDVAPDSVDEGDGGVVRMSANRNLYVTLRDAAGTERGLNIDAANTLGVNDGGGALTVDDGGASLSVNDAGGSLSVDDNGGSLTIDNPALAVVGGGAEVAAQRVTIANDSTGLLSVDDNAGSLTVDNPILSVVGGGTEATAQRVTIANDSTGLLSVDDNAGSLTVDQATHDLFNCNATIQVGDADVTNGNPVPVSDAGGTLTVDNAALSVTGGGAEATALRVTLANDSTGLLSVDDNGGSLTVDGTVTIGAALPVGANNIGDVDVLTVPAPLNVVNGGVEATSLRVTIANDSTGLLSVDDNAGSLTVDNPVLSVVGGGVEATAQRVTIASDSTGLLSVDDNGASLTVDNPILSVVGGGAEATAQRVTIANDSTGVLTVDDGGGALTVDGTVTASNTAGDIADDAADSGNPVKIGGVAVETDGTDPTSVTAEGDRAEARTDRNRRLLVNTAHPNLWSNNNNYGAAQTDTQIQAAPGAGLSLYITDILMSAEGACNILLVRATAGSTTIYGPFYFAANGGLSKHFATPIRLPVNENLGVTSSAAVNHTVSVQGYTAP